jgi:hypothetical protein
MLSLLPILVEIPGNMYARNLLNSDECLRLRNMDIEAIPENPAVPFLLCNQLPLPLSASIFLLSRMKSQAFCAAPAANTSRRLSFFSFES